MLASLVGLPKQAEILIIILLGICFLSLDFSLFHLQEDLAEIWTLQLESSIFLETSLKYIIISTVLIQTFTLHLFLAFHVVMLWPAIFEEKASLMIPWLILGALRCLIIRLLTFSIGLFICQKEKGLSPICFNFLLAQIIQHGPSVYAWMSVLSFYKHISVLQQPKLNEENHKCISVFIAKPRSHSESGLSYNTEQRYFCESFIIQENISEGSKLNLTTIDKIMNTLNVSKEDIEMASENKNNYANLLLEISLNDLEQISSKINLITKGHYSQCCYLNQKNYSNQTLAESEICNVILDNEDKDLRTMTELNTTNEFLHNFVMKKNTSRNFGCQVSMLQKGFFEKSKNQVTKKLLFLGSFGLFQIN